VSQDRSKDAAYHFETKHTTNVNISHYTLLLLGRHSSMHVLLLTNDATAPYMVKSGKSIQIVYPKIIHVTCIIHGLYRISKKFDNTHQSS